MSLDDGSVGQPSVLTIYRDEWRRGPYANEGVVPPPKATKLGLTLLLDEQGQKCCLGFDALACGWTTAQILGLSTPESVVRSAMAQTVAIPAGYESRVRTRPRFKPGSPGFGSVVENTRAVWLAMEANDKGDIDEPTREAQVREHLIELGWDDVVFLDTRPEGA